MIKRSLVKGKRQMRILTWNINGIRSGLTTGGTKVKSVLDGLNADITGFQETKITRDSLTEDVAVVPGYEGFFSCCRKSKRIGYAGVVTYCKTNSATPVAAEEGLTSAYSSAECSDFVKEYDVDVECEFEPDRLRDLDSEGRAVITQHHIRTKDGVMRKLFVINCYCPRVGEDSPMGGDDCRLQYKMDFYRLLEGRAKQFLSAGDHHHVVLMGDFNCSLERIDHCDPDSDPDFDKHPARLWLGELLASGQFVDCFRRLHRDAKESFTCWNTRTGAREINFGTRIDYVLVDARLSEHLLSCEQLTEVVGSDHCPVVVELQVDLIPSDRVPSLCPKHWPQFKGKQSSLKRFLIQEVKSSNSEEIRSTRPPAKKKPKVEATLKNFFSVKPTKPTEEVQLLSSLPSADKMVERTNSSESSSQSEWKKLLGGPVKPPLCKGHSEPCVLRTVKKAGPNLNRQFFVCARPTGKRDNPAASCEYFQWVTKA